MLELVNLEVFGAFAAVVAILVWLVNYFKKEADQKEEVIQKMIDERIESQSRQLEVLETTNQMLNRLLSEDKKDA